jgi:multiple antibiotic resistance protein
VLLAYLVLLVFLVAGGSLTRYLHLQQESLSIAGGIVLFLIALRMIFPSEHGLIGETIDGEPFLVPLAIPLFAGPSTLAALLLLRSTSSFAGLFGEMTIAWAVSAAILLASTFFYRLLRERGLMAMERLMGMLLVMVAVQMLMDGLKVVLAR